MSSSSLGAQIDEANKQAVGRILEVEAMLVDLQPAINAIPGYKSNLVTHAGPLIEWSMMIKVQKLAVINAARAEGLADTPEEADQKTSRGEILLEPNHNYGNVSGMCRVTSSRS